MSKITYHLYHDYSFELLSYAKLQGTIAYYIEVYDINFLPKILKGLKEKGMKVYFAGNLSKTILKHSYLNAVIIKYLGRTIEDLGDSFKIESNCSLIEAGTYFKKRKLGTLMGLSSIPGKIGGSLVNNAGFLGISISDFVLSIEGFSIDGIPFCHQKEEAQFNYRKSVYQSGQFFISSATFMKMEMEPKLITLATNFGLCYRNSHQPIKAITLGSTFVNPEGISAGALLEKMNFDKSRSDSIRISPIHHNFIEISPQSKSEELFNFIEKIRKDVYNTFRLNLRNEIVYWG